MLGGMFSGHTECAGEVIERNGQKLKLFYGMSSETAMKKHSGGVAEYRYVGVGWGVGTAPSLVRLHSLASYRNGMERGLREYKFVYIMVASLVAQLVKSPPAMQETLVRSLGWEDPPGFLGFPGGSAGKRIHLQCGRPGGWK